MNLMSMTSGDNVEVRGGNRTIETSARGIDSRLSAYLLTKRRTTNRKTLG